MACWASGMFPAPCARGSWFKTQTSPLSAFEILGNHDTHMHKNIAQYVIILFTKLRAGQGNLNFRGLQILLVTQANSVVKVVETFWSSGMILV